jgi:hypothetical protein
MTILRGVIHNGQVVLPQPADLPEETEVQIVPMDLAGSADDERPVTSDEIARTLAAMECVQPFEMTDLERAAIEADRRARKEWEKSHRSTN